ESSLSFIHSAPLSKLKSNQSVPITISFRHCLVLEIRVRNLGKKFHSEKSNPAKNIFGYPALRTKLKPLALCFLTGGAPGFQSDADPEAFAKAREDGIPNLFLYNYSSFLGVFFALFAHLFHSCLCLCFPVLPFSSSIVLFRVEDLYIEGLQQCHLLDFAGSHGFAAETLMLLNLFLEDWNYYSDILKGNFEMQRNCIAIWRAVISQL
ncbi:hypothetical protein LINPERPRIM_LOCUS22485, partial [Linum perenne]